MGLEKRSWVLKKGFNFLRIKKFNKNLTKKLAVVAQMFKFPGRFYTIKVYNNRMQLSYKPY